MTQSTPLLAEHQRLGATMVPFGGWQMPLHYGSQIQEHKAVRENVGMFDVSHMCIVDLLGPGVRDYLRFLLVNDIDKIDHRGQAQYNALLNHHAGVIDDLIVYFIDVGHYRIISNAATHKTVLDWLNQHAKDFAVGIQERRDLGIIAIQGPKSLAVLQAIQSANHADLTAMLAPFEFAMEGQFFIARTGYTGENGYEWVLPHKQLVDTWHKLLTQGVTPCGLGARDTLRLEAGYNLSGQDMDVHTTPYESRMGWLVALTPSDREFIGRAALEMQKERGVERQLVGLVLEQPGVLRHHMPVYVGERQVGLITSGSFSPTLQAGIALARIHTPIPTHVEVLVRDKRLPCRVVKPPFCPLGNGSSNK